MTARGERCTELLVVTGFWSLAALNAFLGWVCNWPWMYAPAGLLVVSSCALVWRLRHSTEAR
jgi:hypothetical protein